MKKVLLITITLLAVFVHAQSESDVNSKEPVNELKGQVDNLKNISTENDTTYWTFSGFANLQFGQVALVNWAAGGESSVSATIMGNVIVNYSKGKHRWETSFDGQWGILKNKGQSLKKNVDLLEINSKYGYKISKHLYFSGLLNFKSQFTKTYNFDENDMRIDPHISNLFAPAYMKAGIGVDYIPNSYISFFFSPTTGKYTFVLDNDVEETIYGLNEGNKVRKEFGAFIRAQVQYEIFKNVQLKSILELFNNYTDSDADNRKNIDIDWQTGIDMKINNWLAASIFTHLIYDHNTNANKVDDEGNPVFLKDPQTGIEYTDSEGNPIQQKTVHTQFREAFNLGLTFKFNKERKK